MPSHVDIGGRISKSSNSKEGKYSLRLEYNILGLEKENRAFVDLTDENIKIDYPPDSVGMWVYSYGYSPVTVGIRFSTQDGEKIYTNISNGIGWTGWKYVEAKPPSDLKVYPLKIDRIYVELNENKNHKLVIEAMHRSNREDFKYVICGEGKNRNKIEKLINKYKLNDRVILMGYQKDIRQILVQADIFIMPSFREGLSVALQEAMASGLAAIVTDIRGNRDLIEPQKGGWLVNSNDVNSMINAMNMATCFDTRTIGLYNMKKIKDYDREKVALSMEVIYKKLLEEELC